MPVQSGRVITDTTQGAFNRDSRKEIEQIKREIVKPKEKPATPGSMQGFTRATPGSTTWLTSGPQPRDWTFDTTVDQSPGDKPALQLGGGGAVFGPTEAGWYSTHAQIQFTAGGSITGVLVQANGFSGDLSHFGEAWAHQHFDGRWRVSFWCGPFWCDGTSTVLGLQAFISGSFTAGGVLGTFVDVWRVG
jgi:hypothetical protein